MKNTWKLVNVGAPMAVLICGACLRHTIGEQFDADEAGILDTEGTDAKCDRCGVSLESDRQKRYAARDDDRFMTSYSVTVTVTVNLTGLPMDHTREAVHAEFLERVRVGDEADLDDVEITAIERTTR